MTEFPLIDSIQNIRLPDPPAQRVHSSLINRIKAFEALLEEGEELSVYLPSMPVGFRLLGIGNAPGDLVFFYGEDADGRPVQAFQHHTQTNITLMAVSKATEGEARRIGFHAPFE